MAGHGRTAVAQILARHALLAGQAFDEVRPGGRQQPVGHAVAEGAQDRTTGTVRRVTGRPPNSLRLVAEREL